MESYDEAEFEQYVLEIHHFAQAIEGESWPRQLQSSERLLEAATLSDAEILNCFTACKRLCYKLREFLLDSSLLSVQTYVQSSLTASEEKLLTDFRRFNHAHSHYREYQRLLRLQEIANLSASECLRLDLLLSYKSGIFIRFENPTQFGLGKE